MAVTVSARASKHGTKRGTKKKGVKEKEDHPNATSKAPRKRADRKEKLQARRTHVETVVKACLFGNILGDHSTKRRVQKAIRMRVASYSRRAHAASLGLMHLLQELFDGVDDDEVHTVQLPDFTDQTFIRHMMLGTQGATAANAVIQDFHARHPQHLVQGAPRFTGDRNIYSAGGTLFITNLKNHLRLNLERFIKRTAYAAADSDVRSNAECAKLWTAVCGFHFRNQVAMQLPLREEDARWIARLRNVLGLGEDDQHALSPGWYRLEANLPRILRCFVLLNRRLAELDAPLFQIVPVKSIGTHFISIDTSVLVGVLKDAELVSPECRVTKYDEMGEALWRSHFKIRKLEGGGGRRFTGTLDVDGVCMCMHQTRAKTVLDEEGGRGIGSATGKGGKGASTSAATVCQSVLQPEDRVVGLDPGRTNIMTIAEMLPPGTTRVYTLTRRQYYREAGIVRARSHTEHWHKDIRPSLRALSTVSVKGASLTAFEAYMAVYLAHATALWIQYLKPRWAEQRMRLYGGKKRVFARFFNDVASGAHLGQRTVVAYGSAKFAPGGRGEVSVPTSRAYKECVSRFVTLYVDEFRTSKVHHGTWDVLKRVVKRCCTGRKRDGGMRRRSGVTDVRGLLWYDSTMPNGKSKFVNRDVNAALNIRTCLIGPRPLMLTRQSTGTAQLVLSVGRVLKR